MPTSASLGLTRKAHGREERILSVFFFSWVNTANHWDWKPRMRLLEATEDSKNKSILGKDKEKLPLCHLDANESSLTAKRQLLACLSLLISVTLVHQQMGFCYNTGITGHINLSTNGCDMGPK